MHALNPEEPSYCLDNALECATTLGPMFSGAMSSGDFPWLQAILAVAVTLQYLT